MVERKWVHNPGPAWQYKEIQLRHDEGRWLIRRVGQVWLPDEEYVDEQSAVAVVNTLMDASGLDWVEVPASRV